MGAPRRGGTHATRPRTTLRMVAAEAGVSIATVSYVLSGRTGGRPGIAADTMQRVREAAERLDYHPNQAARAIRTGRTNVVLLSLTMLSDPWALAVSEAVNRAAAAEGLTALILADGDWVRTLQRQSADAVFIDSTEDTPEVRQQLRRLAARGDAPVVFSETIEPDGFDVIRSLALPGADLAMDHLLTGHRRIGALTAATVDRDDPDTRFGRYRVALERAGLPYREDWIGGFELSPASAFTAATRILSSRDRPDALYVTTDFAAMAAIQAALRLRLRVPQDVAVIGLGNTIEGATMTPSLSSVGPDTDFFDRLAEIVRDRATGAAEGPGRTYRFEWRLHVRDSTQLSTQLSGSEPGPTSITTRTTKKSPSTQKRVSR